MLLVGGADHSAQLWGPRTLRPLGPVMTHQAIVADYVAISPNSSFIATSQGDGVVRVWQVARSIVGENHPTGRHLHMDDELATASS